eukprot:jgi/Mesvir1/26975/Mv20688-RA.1
MGVSARMGSLPGSSRLSSPGLNALRSTRIAGSPKPRPSLVTRAVVPGQAHPDHRFQRRLLDDVKMKDWDDFSIGKKDVKTHVNDLIAKHGVCVFTKSTDVNCGKVRQQLKDAGADAHFIDIDKDANIADADYSYALFAMTKKYTVPHIFIGGKFVGGSQALDTMQQSGQLRRYIDALKEKSTA